MVTAAASWRRLDPPPSMSMLWCAERGLRAARCRSRSSSLHSPGASSATATGSCRLPRRLETLAQLTLAQPRPRSSGFEVAALGVGLDQRRPEDADRVL